MKIELIKLELKEEEFQKFKSLIKKEAGINLKGLRLQFVQSRLAKRLRVLSLNNFTEYYEYLIKNYDKEKKDFINSFTTNETYFFRENHHFEYLKKEFLPFLETKKSKTIRIWSSACSTGEEPYTLAIALPDYFKDKKMPDIKILATDIDTSVLETARKGIYSDRSIMKVPPLILKDYFQPVNDPKKKEFRVNDEVRNLIYFNRLNLQDKDYPMQKKFDIIFCRNVIIYFTKETQQEIFKKMSKYLFDHGRLFIGHSENITSISKEFFLIGNTIYRKAE